MGSSPTPGIVGSTAHLVMHLPFPAADASGLEWGAPRTIAVDGVSDDAAPHDLRLQQYAPDLAGDMLAALPHRVHSAELRSWPGAWIDLWSLDVACLWVVEPIELELRDLSSYRERVEARRETVRAQGAERLGRPPLWLCLLHVVPADAPREELDDIAATLTDHGASCALDAFPAVALRLGLDACVALPPSELEVGVSVARMIALHTAIWAAAMQYDRELLPLLARMDEAAPLSELERRADRLRETSRRVRAFRAPLANTAAHLSELDGPLWRALADRWALDPQLDALTDRIEALQQTHADLIAALTSKHARRLNRIALALALISGSTAVFAVVQFVIVEPQDTEVRLANLVVVAVVAALAVWLWRLSVDRAGAADRTERRTGG